MHGAHSTEHNKTRSYKRGYTIKITDEERAARSSRMGEMRRAVIAKATGAAS